MTAAYLGAPKLQAGDNDRAASCDGKTRYTGPGTANAAIKQRAWRTSGRMKVYHCRYCGFWHVGRTTKLDAPGYPQKTRATRIDPADA